MCWFLLLFFVYILVWICFCCDLILISHFFIGYKSPLKFWFDHFHYFFSILLERVKPGQGITVRQAQMEKWLMKPNIPSASIQRWSIYLWICSFIFHNGKPVLMENDFDVGLICFDRYKCSWQCCIIIPQKYYFPINTCNICSTYTKECTGQFIFVIVGIFKALIAWCYNWLQYSVRQIHKVSK